MNMSEVKRFEQKVGVLTLSGAMREGNKMILESRLWLTNRSGCALCAAAVATGHPPEYGDLMSIVSHLLKVFPHVERDTLLLASAGHYEELYDTAGCADWLEARGL